MVWDAALLCSLVHFVPPTEDDSLLLTPSRHGQIGLSFSGIVCVDCNRWQPRVMSRQAGMFPGGIGRIWHTPEVTQESVRIYIVATSGMEGETEHG